ncbi:lanthionine synthetase LanC family protein [Streptomyces sp. enrichment culture]|uniref:lanthionine synthetase LanC family protein n=1 Tax=Streptomyces sp. enrichment culture TaxID=1795815 RepID=UPI003F54EFE6
MSEQVDITGPDSFLIDGRPFTGPSVHGSTPRKWTDEHGQLPVGDPSAADQKAKLAALLYDHCYIRPHGADRAAAHLTATRDFQSALTNANTGRGTWEPGWSVEEVSAGPHVVVSRHGVRFWVPLEQVRTDVAGMRNGQECQVHVPKEYRCLQRDYYLILGDADTERVSGRGAEESMVRLYWHLTSATAPHFVAVLSRLMNAAFIPFRAKVLNAPHKYKRADAGVVYLAGSDFLRARGLLGRVHAEVYDGLRNEVPLFTKRLAPGLAIAEDPGNGLSFGQHRCRLVATALCKAHGDGRTDVQWKRHAIESVFRGEGLDPEVPHLTMGAVDTYCLDSMNRTGRFEAERRSSDLGMKRDDFLTAAVRIGDTLCAQARWDSEGTRCNWTGRSNHGAFLFGASGPKTAALGPDIYAGASGISLFLAELFTHTGVTKFRRTALGAARCALRQVEQRRGTSRQLSLGFYTGVTGVAFAAWWVGLRTDARHELRGLMDVLLEGWPAPDRGGPDDLLGGKASAIPVLLHLSRNADLSRCREWANTLGEELCRSEVMHRYAAPRRPTGDAPLTGFSHGAAGIGLALLELHKETGRDHFLTFGRRAFAYEDELFDPVERNWPDLRPPVGPERDPSSPRFAISWCHGAPGIALSRLRAAKLDAAYKDDYVAKARTGLDKTRDSLEQRRPAHTFDATPCHGVTGLIESLWIGGSELAEPEYKDAALKAAQELVPFATGDDWRSGVACGGPNPSLMLGHAGLGYHFLRLHNPQAVRPLLVVPSTETGKSGSSAIGG